MRVKAPSRILVRDVAGEAFILDVEKGEYMGLDPVGTRMLATLAASESIEAAYRDLLSEYDVDPEILRRDLTAFIEQALEHNLVELESGPIN